jgi:predicted DNA binding protein
MAPTKIKSGTATLTDMAKQFGCSPQTLSQAIKHIEVDI